MTARRNPLLAGLVAMLVVALVAATAPSMAQEGPTKGEGTEDRNWVDGPQEPPADMSAAEYEVAVAVAAIPMSDGMVLNARLYLPVRPPTEEPGPCVISADGYGPPSVVGALTGLPGQFLDLASRGYASAHVFMRTVAVPADEALYYKYGEDGYDIVEWMAAQPWCDGNVGMIGPSLLGISQWLTAREAPPSLKAIAPTISCGDCYWHLWYKGGMLPGSGREGRTPPIAPYDEYAAGSQHRDYDEWWLERNTTTEHHQAMADDDIAVLHCGGWDDYIYAGGLRAVEEIVAAGGHGMQIIGPCSHGGATPTLMPYSFETFRVLWFDRFLKGIDNGIDEGPGALFYVEGADQYRFEDQWPIPDTRWVRLHLQAQESGSAASLNDGSLISAAPGEEEAGVSYEYSPEGPFNNAGGAGARRTEDKRQYEEHSLTWTTPPLITATEVTGWPKLTFWASATAEDTDFVVEITDVAPDGRSTQVSRGWLNAARSFDRTDPPSLVPGQVYEFEAELWPMSYVFRPGHRIRVMVSGSDSPGAAPNPHPATVTLYQDAERPSYLELPIVGTSWERLVDQPVTH